MTSHQTPRISYAWMIACLLIMSWLLVGCAGLTAQVALVEPVSGQVEYENYEIKNCDGSLSDLHEPVKQNFEVKEEVVLSDQATAAASEATYVLSEAEKQSLAEQVKKAYGEKYTAAQTELEKQEFVAPQDRIATFQITWSKQVYKSTLEYEANGEARRVEYQYTLTIPKVGQMTLHICGG